MKIDFILNGKPVAIDTKPERRLVDVLRDDFGLLSVKNSCYAGECGGCTVLMDKQTVPSCHIPVFSVRSKQITTMEGFRGTEKYLDIYKAFEEAEALPCQFCFAGKVFAVDRLIDNRRIPETDEIMALLADHGCNCTSVSAFIKAVRTAYQNREIRGELMR